MEARELQLGLEPGETARLGGARQKRLQSRRGVLDFGVSSSAMRSTWVSACCSRAASISTPRIGRGENVAGPQLLQGRDGVGVQHVGPRRRMHSCRVWAMNSISTRPPRRIFEVPDDCLPGNCAAMLVRMSRASAMICGRARAARERGGGSPLPPARATRAGPATSRARVSAMCSQVQLSVA